MTNETILYIILAGVFSAALAIFMYGYKSKQGRQLSWVFGILRFMTLFFILLLLINPKFESNIYTTQKPKLPVLIDNSESVSVLKQDENVRQLVERVEDDRELNKKFDVSLYSFGSKFAGLDSLSFSERNTNIAAALTSTNEIFRHHTAPTILVTDGNQTLGNDYEFLSSNLSNPVYPVVLGDSVQYRDLRIEQLNTNRYAFLKNQFPVEVLLTYSGAEDVKTEFVINQGTSTLYRATVSFTEKNNSTTLNFHLPANAVGLQKYTAEITPLENEKNKTNNVKHFAVEVIDQATNVLIVSKLSHPDLGALKKSISTNEQRTVTLKSPSEAAGILNDYQLVILYQPDRSFAGVLSEIKKLGKNSFIITGLQTDWPFLSSSEKFFLKKTTGQKEDVQAKLNANYATFAVEDIGFNNYPPLHAQFGQLEINVPHETMLEQTVRGIGTESPMLSTIESNGVRTAIWDGEGFWRWRANSLLKTDSFKDFDAFIGSLVQYLSSNKRRNRLEVSSETFYYNNNPVLVSAQYFDKNYLFDNRGSLNISVKNLESEKESILPMLLRNNFYEVDLSNLPAGEYEYKVSVSGENLSHSGSFSILEYNVEQQFLNADVGKLKRVALNSGGKVFFPNEIDALINTLLADDSYKNIEIAERKTVPLIDWKYLLALIVIALSAEWFIRKYNGLI